MGGATWIGGGDIVGVLAVPREDETQTRVEFVVTVVH